MIVFDDDIDQEVTYQRVSIKNNMNIFENFVRSHILTLTSEPVSEEEQDIINGINEGIYNYDNTISIMLNLGNFKVILLRALKYFGNDGNYNWLDVSGCKSFLGLFSSPQFSNFNGDITKWDTSNVTNMQKIFFGCSKFKRDITGWNVKNVKFIDKLAYSDSTGKHPANPELAMMFQTMKKEGKFAKSPMVKL